MRLQVSIELSKSFLASQEITILAFFFFQEQYKNQNLESFLHADYEPQLQREVMLSSSVDEDVGKLDEENFFLISAYDFRRIIRELAIYYHHPGNYN